MGLDLPKDLKELFTGCSVICLKGLTDSESCTVIRDILKAIYESLDRESKRVELLVVLEEASTFLPGNVTREAREIAKEVRSLITRIAREKAKYGCVFLIITQSQSDFRDDSKIVREMVSARFFLRSTDRADHEYIEHYVSKEAAETIKILKVGEAVMHSVTLSGVKFYVRAPFSSVREVTDKEIVEINKKHNYASRAPNNDTIRRMYEPTLNEKETQALTILKEFYETHNKPILAEELALRLKIPSGGSRQRWLGEMEKKGLARKVTVKRKRGRPAMGLSRETQSLDFPQYSWGILSQVLDLWAQYAQESEPPIIS